MTSLQERHLASIQEAFLGQSGAKYAAGQKEHGGNLWEKPGQLDGLVDELVDGFAYAKTLRDQLRQIKQAAVDDNPVRLRELVLRWL